MGQTVHGYKDLQQGRGRLLMYVGAKTKCDGCKHRLRRGDKVQVFHRGTKVLCLRVSGRSRFYIPSCGVTYGIVMAAQRKSKMIAKHDAIYEGSQRLPRRRK